jgi:hypothetical protein
MRHSSIWLALMRAQSTPLNTTCIYSPVVDDFSPRRANKVCRTWYAVNRPSFVSRGTHQVHRARVLSRWQARHPGNHQRASRSHGTSSDISVAALARAWLISDPSVPGNQRFPQVRSQSLSRPGQDRRPPEVLHVRPVVVVVFRQCAARGTWRAHGRECRSSGQ